MDELKQGYNVLTETDGVHSDMMQDTGIYVFTPGEEAIFSSVTQESAFLLLSGKIKINWLFKDKVFEKLAQRNSLFDEKPICLHVPINTAIKITAETSAEVLIQKTENKNEFEPSFYESADVSEKILCDGLMQNTARRILRDIFNYDNAPYSNMVMGEVVTFPGRWSSFPPHHHPQPEIYFYRFDKPQGFGISIIGDNPIKVVNNSVSAIPGGLVHPQVSAPGYAMYYCWMIRHLENNPWTTRTDDKDHEWLYEKDADIWEDKS